ncbi:Calcium-binding EF-hand [Corchorus capsularis]|uniref:Calcium-binding EF-hand n=1 Tax=Corchorus capsularis TaxID=210143 RepID=A0A1R3GF39_COCAP|nr:Calcium-binding EF-hand [Corchorus capsularis]
MAIKCIEFHPSREMSMTVDEFKAWLHNFDADRDGRISQEELKDALQSLRVRFGWWKAQQGMKECKTKTIMLGREKRSARDHVISLPLPAYNIEKN